MKKPEERFYVERFKESHTRLSEDILREIPKQDDSTRVEIKPIIEGLKPIGAEVTVKGTF